MGTNSRSSTTFQQFVIYHHDQFIQQASMVFLKTIFPIKTKEIVLLGNLKRLRKLEKNHETFFHEVSVFQQNPQFWTTFNTVSICLIFTCHGESSSSHVTQRNELETLQLDEVFSEYSMEHFWDDISLQATTWDDKKINIKNVFVKILGDFFLIPINKIFKK